MLNGFDEQTKPLDDYERDVLLPIITKGLRTKIGKQRAVTNSYIITSLKEKGFKKLQPARVRKIINHIRVNGILVNLVASSNGYYIEPDREERKKYAQSIRQRAEAILAVLNYIEL